MQWKPAQAIREFHPETLLLLDNLDPSIAAYCGACGELWLVLLESG
jgi:hypothetical protein